MCWRWGLVAVAVLLAAACGGDSGETGELTTTVLDVEVRDVDTAGAEAVCEEYVVREVPEGHPPVGGGGEADGPGGVAGAAAL